MEPYFKAYFNNTILAHFKKLIVLWSTGESWKRESCLLG